MRKHFNSLFDIFDFVLRKTQGSFSGRLLFAMIYQLFTSNPLRLYGGYNKPVNVATKHLFCSCNDSGKDHQSCFPCAAAPINFVHLVSHITFFLILQWHFRFFEECNFYRQEPKGWFGSKHDTIVLYPETEILKWSVPYLWL